MAQRITYYPGGLIPAAAQQNRAELLDSTAGTFTSWAPDGTVTASRALTTAEAADLSTVDAFSTGAVNQATLQQQARTALVNNRTYTALAAPSTAQNTAQIKALSQQINGVIRLLLGQLDATN